MAPAESPVVDAAARDKYMLQVTAGPAYDAATHSVVNVNGPAAHVIENDVAKCWLRVRIRDYHGLPRGSPASSGYFSHPLHTADRYSIAFSFVPKHDMGGDDVVTGFDFDHSIRSRLPPGFKTAMRIVTTVVDPGVYSDPYSDKPYLYGPGLSSFFAFRVGERVDRVPAEHQLAVAGNAGPADEAVICEGAHGSGDAVRSRQHAVPAQSSKRRRHFLAAAHRARFVFEAGRLYQADFFNPYLDFANLALRIPGFSISVARYIDDKTHQLRFVMRNRATGAVLFVVVFTLLFGQKLADVLGSATPLSATPSSATPSSATPSSRSAASRRGSENASGAGGYVGGLASSIYSTFTSLGFGRAGSGSSASVARRSSGSEASGGKKPG